MTVITKIDMRESNEPIQALSGGLGFVCVRNRTSEEQANGMTFEQITPCEKFPQAVNVCFNSDNGFRTEKIAARWIIPADVFQSRHVPGGRPP